MHIFLYGPSGSGKTTVGAQLAGVLDIPLLDMDAEIEKTIHQPISDFMVAKGEASFREIESRLLKECVEGVDKVISLGGGALLNNANRNLIEASGQVVFLHADLPVLVERLTDDQNKRPLLAGDLEKTLGSLLKEREAHYVSFPMRVDASQAPQQVAWDIQRLLGRYHLCSMPPAYDVVARTGGLNDLGEMLKSRELCGPVLVVSDTNVAPLYMQSALVSLQNAGYIATELVILAGETHKNIESVMSIWQACLHADLDRKSTIISLGGGVVGDLAGFAAATFMRGCRWAAVPTTLLAMVDASMGGKTGFDLPEGKNLAGAFYPPRLVLADPQVLATLPPRELRAGLAEVVKHGVIADPKLFDMCASGWDAVVSNLPEIVRRAMSVKVKVIEEDPFEQAQRASLNFGHTIGHALELASNFDLLHGEAVALGMLAETRLSEKLNIAEKGLAQKLMKVLDDLGLPVEIPADIAREAILPTMQMDKKKSAGIIRFALPLKIGQVHVGIEVDDLSSKIEEIL